MNAVFAYATSALKQWPEPMYSIYLAFDNGEFRHHGDSDSVDPEQAYTRSQLTTILKEADAD